MSGLEGLLAGRTLVGRYRVEEVIGRGGFAAVYRAVDERLGRTVAVKVITIGSSDSEARDEIRRRFDREARAAASLHHPNVVTVYDFGTDAELGLDFLVMELLRGEDLRARLARPDPLPARVAVRVLRDAAWGLGAGHAGGLIHRDVKPGNVFLAAQERAQRFRVCVLDFGIAQIKRGDDTTTRFTRGPAPLSPAYASPEQLRAERHLTPASDVFGLGVIGYQMLAGERPFGPTEVDRMARGEPVPVPRLRDRAPEVPEEVEAVILRALSFAAEDRFPDAREMADALDRAYSVMRDAPVPVPVPEAAPVVIAPAPPPEAPPAPPSSEPAPPPRVGAASYARPRARRRFRAAPLAMLLLLVAGALAAWWALGRDTDPEPRVARAPAAPAAPAGPITGGTDTASWHAPGGDSPRPGSPGAATTQRSVPRTTTPRPAGPRTAVAGGAPAAG
ncbi:MAG TPA: serine/threonine-protein kinase, partial [Longimicrobiaceae bacterium]